MNNLSAIKAGEIMTKEPLTAAGHWSVETLIDFLTRHKINGAPVQSENKQLIGVVSMSDVIRFDTNPEEVLQDNPMSHYYHTTLEGFSPEQLGLTSSDLHRNHLVREIMTDEVISHPEETSVATVARTMADNGIHRVFITGEEQQITGVITTLDILQLITDSE